MCTLWYIQMFAQFIFIHFYNLYLVTKPCMSNVFKFKIYPKLLFALYSAINTKAATQQPSFLLLEGNICLVSHWPVLNFLSSLHRVNENVIRRMFLIFRYSQSTRCEPSRQKLFSRLNNFARYSLQDSRQYTVKHKRNQSNVAWTVTVVNWSGFAASSRDFSWQTLLCASMYLVLNSETDVPLSY